MTELNKQKTHYEEASFIDTPYMRASMAWDERQGNIVKQSRNWRLFSFLLVIALLACVGALVYQSLQIKVKPIIVRVNEDGAPLGTHTIDTSQYEPNVADIRWILSFVVTNTRSLIQDPIAISQNWKRAYAFLSKPAQAQMAELANASGTVELIDKIRNKAQDRVSRVVEMHSFLPMTKNTYQLRWSEKTYSSNGNLLATQAYSGSFTIEVSETQNEETAFTNPRGLYITSFAITRDLR